MAIIERLDVAKQKGLIELKRLVTNDNGRLNEEFKNLCTKLREMLKRKDLKFCKMSK